MKKITSLILVIMLVMISLIACGDKTPGDDIYKDDEKVDEQINNDKKEKVKVQVVVPAGTPTMSLLKMMKEKTSLGENVEVSYDSIAQTDVLTSKIISKEAQIAIVPTNMASIMYNKNKGYEVVATSIWGNLYLVSSEPISSVDQLKGKEINMIGKGMTPDIIFRYLLKNIGLDPEKDVTLKYVSGATELAPAFISGKSSVSMMPEPMLSMVKMKKEDTNVILDFQEEWKSVTGQDNGYPQASVIVSKDLIKDNYEIVAKFLDEYSKNIEWINNNPEKAGEYAEELELGMKKAVVSKSLAGSNIKYVSVAEAKDSIKSYLTVLKDFSADTIGGQMPDEKFYFEKK